MNSASSLALLLDVEGERIESVSDSTWEACIYSRKCPDKETSNEDGAVVVPKDEESVVFAVADGCGGMRGGDQAARIALEVLADRVTGSRLSQQSLRGVILDAFDEANQAIMDLRIGAGCTMAVAEVHQGAFRSYHVGDSKILITNSRGRIRYQSICHSQVGYAVASGLLAPRRAMHHPNRHLVFNTLGCPNMKVEVGPAIKFTSTDRILLASDGLTDNLYTEEIIERLRKGSTVESIQKLSHLAARRMDGMSTQQPCKPDDLTMIVARMAPWNVQS